MKDIKLLICSCLSVLLWTSCENDRFYYQDQPRARISGPYIWALGTDSLLFSFATTANDITEKQINMTLFVMGNVSNHDRTANITVISDKTIANNDQYSFPATVTVPANLDSISFPVILKRTGTLKNQTAKLYIAIAGSTDFAVGVNEQNHFLFKWNDILSKPINWDTVLKPFFGSYSDTKYRFMLSQTGVTEFTDKMSWAELQNYKIKVTNALNAYNKTHSSSPLTDENGILVSFNN